MAWGLPHTAVPPTHSLHHPSCGYIAGRLFNTGMCECLQVTKKQKFIFPRMNSYRWNGSGKKKGGNNLHIPLTFDCIISSLVMGVDSFLFHSAL